MSESQIDYGKARAVLGPLMQYVREQLRSSTDVFLDRAHKTLSESWPTITEHRKQDAARFAANWLGSNKATIQSALHQRLIGAMSAEYTPGAAQASDLHIMDNATLNASLMRAKMVSRVMDGGRHELDALEARFEQLRKAGLSLNPQALGPGALADGFLAVLRDLKVPDEVQALLLDAYGDQGVQLLIEFYQGINRELIERGVAPTLQIRNRRTFRHEQPQEMRDQARRELTAQLDAQGGWTPGLFRQMLEAQVGHVASAAAGAPAGQPFFTPVQLRAVDQLEALALDWLGDQRISRRVRTELTHLLQPMLGVQVANPDSFAVADGPARVFLRELARLGYRDQEMPVADFDAVRSVIERILAEGGREMESFRSGANVLHTLVQQELQRRLEFVQQQLRDREQQREREQREAEARAEEARHQVALELNDRGAGLEMDPAVAGFALELLGPWMIERHLRFGATSPQWTEARSFATQFFDAARPALSDEDQLRKQALRARVVREARLRTQGAVASPARAAKLLGDLERYFQTLVVQLEHGAPPQRPRSTVDFIRTLSAPAAR